MKFIANTLLVILTIPIFIILVLSVNTRFHFMSTEFWLGSFEKADVYSQISANIKNRLDSRVIAEGGSLSDVTVLSNLVSAASLKTFVEDNVSSILAYANGHSEEIIVSIPLPTTHLPDDLDIGNTSELIEKMPLKDFIKEFGISGLDESDIVYISKFGIWVWEILILSSALLILVVILMYRLTKPMKRLVIPGVALTLSGVVTLLVYFVGDLIRTTLAENLANTSNLGTSLMVIMGPPLISNMIYIWSYFGVVALILGISLIFIRKPAYNKYR